MIKQCGTRKIPRSAKKTAALGMTSVVVVAVGVVAVVPAGMASATTYYVDPAGSNANDGLSPQTAWRTLLKVGISAFQPGDQILFKRDAVWNEWLTPPSSGAAGNP